MCYNPAEMTPVRISAPGRICLFGEHQDYLGLPVLAAAVNLRIGIEAHPRATPGFSLRLPDISQSVELEAAGGQPYAEKRDYLRSAINVLARRGHAWPLGYDAVIHGDIPINAGVSSSSAMVIMWLRFLLHAAQPAEEVDAVDLATLGFHAEVAEFGEPGGMMDHFCAAVGGVLAIKTTPPFGAERLAARPTGFVLGHTLQPKATLELLGRNRRDVTEGMRLISEALPGFDLSTTPLAEAEPHLAALPPDPRRKLRANLVNRDITVEARRVLAGGTPERLGGLLTRHHEQLRDGLDLSTDKMERMMNASLAAGALGGKVNGSGGGGCMFAYAPGCEEAVAEAIRSEGGVPYIVSIDEGARHD